MLYGKAEKGECQPVCKEGFHYSGKGGCTIVELGFALEWKEWLHYSVKDGWTMVERDEVFKFFCGTLYLHDVFH